MADKKQAAIFARLQLKLLEDFERLLTDGKASAADRNTIAKLLTVNGWSLDETKLPQKIRDLIGDMGAPTVISDDDVDTVN